MVHVDIERAYQTGPDLPDIIRSEAGRALVKHCMETRRATVRGFTKLVQKVINMAHGGTLPTNAETIQNQVPALAWLVVQPKARTLPNKHPLYLTRQRGAEKEVNG